MYAVIFRAEFNHPDAGYSAAAARLRQLALNDYGCLKFISCSEDGREIAISYWSSLEDIQAWKNNTEHRKAQELGKSRWYKSYKVEVVEILREYGV
jgi:heme-degrading monooxygenase HmoA